MPEWLNGTVSKTVYRHRRYEGSNPSLSAFARRSFSEGGLRDYKPIFQFRAGGDGRSPLPRLRNFLLFKCCFLLLFLQDYLHLS